MIVVRSAVAVVCAFMLGSAATAQTFSPDGPRSLVGDAVYSKGLTIDCTVSGSASVTGGMARIDSLKFNGLYCPFFSGFPYAITANSPTSLTFRDVVVSGIDGDCTGDLTGTCDQAADYIECDGVQIPTSTGGNNCRITGYFLIDPPASITF